jgi:regulator of sigma E protease
VGSNAHPATQLIDFLAVLFGYAISGERTLEAFYDGLQPFAVAFMAFLSLNLAVLNLLPIPILDGGQVVFLVAEAVRRRPLSVQLRSRLTQIGFFVLVGIMLLALRNDVVRVFPHVFSR